jgi:hypothetical protein
MFESQCGKVIRSHLSSSMSSMSAGSVPKDIPIPNVNEQNPSASV